MCLAGQARLLQEGLVRSDWKDLVLFPQPGGQGNVGPPVTVQVEVSKGHGSHGVLFVQFPLGQIKLWEARVEEVDGSPQSHDQVKTSGRGLEPAASFTVAVQPQEQGPTYLLIQSQHEKVGDTLTNFIPSICSTLYW